MLLCTVSAPFEGFIEHSTFGWQRNPVLWHYSGKRPLSFLSFHRHWWGKVKGETGHINELCVYNRKPGTELGVRGWKELPRSAWSNKMIISSFVLLPKRELCHVGRMTWAGRTDIWRECVKCNLKFLLWCTPLLSPHTFSKIFLHASFFKIIFGLICFALLWQSRKRGMLYLSEI